MCDVTSIRKASVVWASAMCIQFFFSLYSSKLTFHRRRTSRALWRRLLALLIKSEHVGVGSFLHRGQMKQTTRDATGEEHRACNVERVVVVPGDVIHESCRQFVQDPDKTNVKN
jgi:hypothetical protein